MSLMLKKCFFIGGLIPGIIILLSGCMTANSDEAASLAARQAELLRTRLPIQSADYSWVRAESTGSVIAITVIDNSPRSSPDARRDFVHNFQQRLCSSPSVRLLLSKQVVYRIFMKDVGRVSAAEAVIDNVTCKS